MIRHARDEGRGIGVEDVERFHLVAIFAVAARDKICAARRGFSLAPDAPRRLVPQSVRARQVTG